MTGQGQTFAQMILLVGLLVVLATTAKAALARIAVPALIGYLLLGFLLRLADHQWHFLSSQVEEALEFLARVGIVMLLFRVGLESDLEGLKSQLRRASGVWVGNVVVSAGLGFLGAYYLLGLQLIPSLFVATALSATSVGVAVDVWQEEDALNSPNGQLLVDVAEMDDITGVALMALLFAVVPVLREGGGSSFWPALGSAAGLFAVKATLFAAACYLLARYVESDITRLSSRLMGGPEGSGLMLTVAGLGLIIAAIAGWLGFSLAIGALFAGLVFSRDPEAVKTDAAFGVLQAFFVPFFFIGIGLSIEPGALTSGLWLGMGLLLVAVVGKMLGTSGPTLLTTGLAGALIVGVSMVPRAEISMIIMQQGRNLGDWAVPPSVYAGMVLVTAVTCVVAPLVLRPLFQRWPQSEEGSEEES